MPETSSSDVRQPQVGIVMGSKSDWESTMKAASDALTELGIPHEVGVVSAHRTPDWIRAYVEDAIRKDIQVIIAGAGGAAHLPGMLAAETNRPVIGVPVKSSALQGLDSLLSIVQMPGGVPTPTMSIGESGAKNAAITAARILGLKDPAVAAALENHVAKMRADVANMNVSMAGILTGLAQPISAQFQHATPSPHESPQ